MWFAIVGLLLAAVSQIASGVMSYKATKQTNEQNQANYEDWKQYNSPAEQMNRLQDAGLNPYMVNGVSNTLSQPFQVQNNQGLSSLFSGLSAAMSQGVSGLNKSEANRIQWANTRIKQKQLKLNEIGLDIRRDLANTAMKLGDAKAALLWSQGSLADLNAKFWSDMDDVRRNRYISDATIAASNADFLTEFNPLRLGYYNEFYPLALEGQAAKNSLTKAQTSQLFWSRAFMERQLEQQMALGWARANNAYELGMLGNQLGWARLGQDWTLGSGRLDLQRDYYSLAHKKWLSGMLFDWLKMRRSTQNAIINKIPLY